MDKRVVCWFSLWMALCLVVASLPGCSPKGPATVAKAEVLQSDKPRLSAPSLQEARVPDLVAGNTLFAFDLYRTLFDQELNVFYSPYSISLALAMTYAGARGNTALEMAQALHLALPQERLRAASNALDQALASRGTTVTQEGERFRLHVANALWGQKGYAFLATFLDLLAQNHGAGLRLLDFQGATEASRQAINQWVEEQTEQRIRDLLPSGSITPLTRLVLSNAIYFNAGWMYPFPESATADGAFYLLKGSTVNVPLMQQSERLGYAEGPGYQAVELPYLGGELSMVVLLPAEGQFERLAQGLDAAQLADILGRIEHTQVALTLPRFKYESEFPLKEALQRLGMEEAFSTNADFSGMDGRRDLFIDNVYHKAFVAVDEKGTEAAAATAVVIALTSMPAEPKEVRVDRPFLFLIRDVESGAILFLGHVVNPTK